MTNSNIYITIKDWINIVQSLGTFDVNTIMEIGSMDGKDAYELSEFFEAKNVHIIEAHPLFYEQIAKKYPYFTVSNIAASNKNGTFIFNSVTPDSSNLGMSSLLEREESYPSYDIVYEPLEAPCLRMDDYCGIMFINSIDLLKIDVEGLSYEVLEGFGDALDIVKCIHVECEHESVWKGQKLYPDVEKLLIGKGFIPISMRIGFPQSDSVWVRKELYNPNWAD
jgi:FkbM family methyltransferase